MRRPPKFSPAPASTSPPDYSGTPHHPFRIPPRYGYFRVCVSLHRDRQGGANGSIRFEPEINHGANAGLTTALQLLKPIKKKFEEVGWADLMQLASATAVEVAGESHTREGRREQEVLYLTRK